jgi:hypothetical protein
MNEKKSDDVQKAWYGEEAEFFSRKETALLLGVKPQTLAVWAMKNIGPAPTKIGKRSVRYRRDILEAYISKNTMPR